MLKLASKESVDLLRRLFQFLVAITLFFPTSLAALFAAFGMSSDKTIASWGALVVVLILTYLVIELMAHYAIQIFITIINALTFLAILAFVPVLLVFASHGEPVVPDYLAVAFQVGLYGTMILPTVIFITLSTYGAILLGTHLADHGFKFLIKPFEKDISNY